MTGVVLCGGQSTRMGSDKGLLNKQNVTWVEIAASKLSALQVPVILSVNKEQIDSYSQIFPANQLIIDDENISVKGPLLGVLSAHQHFPFEDLLVLACDMIDMEEALLQNLLRVYNENFCEAYVFETNGKVQPLCAVYTSKGLKQVLELYRQNQLKKFSMMHVLECIKTKFISADAFAKNFTNYNSAEDLAADDSIYRVS